MGGAKAAFVIPVACYGLFLLAWIVDLVTPQSFVVSILLNGPIALSALALQSRLTVRLMVLAEIANVIAAYVNGVAADSHWDAIALGNRAISAATFVLVGVLTIRAADSARRAGESDERNRQIERERRLRSAMEHVRASLNLELVFRSAVREAAKLTNASRVMLCVRASSLDIPDTYEMLAGEPDVTFSRAQLPAEFTSVAERARSTQSVVVVDPSDPVGRLFGEHALVSTFDLESMQAILLIGRGMERPSVQERDVVQAFVDNVSVALRQAQLFIRLAEQNIEIAQQKDRLSARGDVIRDIVYALAHDLRTPLTAADVTMKQALQGAYGTLPDRYREILRSAVASNTELQGLVETLLLVARYESGEDSQIRRLESVDALVQRVAADLRPMAEATSIELQTVACGQDVAIEVDAVEVRRALVNLVANAIEATPARGRIEILPTKHDGRIRFDVSDDGYGVPLERRAMLFSRFSGARAGGGTGLGLYIVRRIAEKYGGAAGYEPREPRGSRFYIELPQALGVYS